MALVDVDLGSGRDVSVIARPGDDVVLTVRSFGSTGRLWRLRPDAGRCEAAGHDAVPGGFGRAGVERFTVRVGGLPCTLRLLLQAPWAERPDREFRIDVSEEMGGRAPDGDE